MRRQTRTPIQHARRVAPHVGCFLPPQKLIILRQEELQQIENKSVSYDFRVPKVATRNRFQSIPSAMSNSIGINNITSRPRLLPQGPANLA